jgi:iron-sulfur cluster repair protein YtfE (RIC family)
MPTREPDIEEIPPELMLEPLNWLFAEHYRHRQLCRAIDRLATPGAYDGDRIGRVLAFLREDLPLHVIDEEEDLFPLLRRRSEPGDELETVLGVLSAEHRADIDKAANVCRHLEAAREARRAPGHDPDARKALTEFAAQERRHVALENAVVLPIARLRLSEGDLRTLSQRLAARRGILLELGAA